MHTLLLALACLAVVTSAAYIEVPEELLFPGQADEKHQILTAPYLLIDGVQTPLDYNIILRSGQRANQSEQFSFGQFVDAEYMPLNEVGTNGQRNSSNITVSQSADFVSILQVQDKLFSFVHFESPTPSAVYLMELQQDTQSCHLRAISQRPTDWSAWGGLWTPCAGSVTPWQTHIGSEEYEPNAMAIAAAQSLDELEELTGGYETIRDFLRYWGIYEANVTLADIQEYFLPYRYGHATEMTAHYNGSYTVVKHFAMGRQSYELPKVMPDNATVYCTDDGENTMLTIYRATTPGDLSCGTLYGAKFTQTAAENGGNFTIEWLDMGEACDDDIRPWAENTTFFDIFEYVPFNNATKPGCPEGFRSTNTGMVKGAECLRLLPGMELIASRFETRRYLAYIGGTTEFTKWEGLTLAPDHGEHGRIYTSVSRIENSMEDNAMQGDPSSQYDEGGPNSIRLDWNRCGCVYTLDLNATYAATNMWALVCGNTKNNTNSKNKCDIDAIAAPDNIAMIQSHNELIIGEDTSDHQNDVVWLYNFESQSLRRVQSTPFGSESTGAYWYENINGCSYWISVVQHPYGESDQKAISDYASTGKASYVGYLGPIRAPQTSDAATAAGRR